MTRTTALVIAVLAALPGALAQDGPKDDKDKARQAEAAAKKAIDAYQADMAKATTHDAAVAAIRDHLDGADPHPLIRSRLTQVLQNHPSVDARIAAVDALGRYKKDKEAARTLIQNSKVQKDAELQKKCLRRFGAVAPYGMSVELKWWFPNENHALAREAIEAAEAVNSIRMLQPLVELLGELERINDKEAQNPGQDPPLPGVPDGTSKDSNYEKVKRKKELIDPTRKAVNMLWKKHDPKTQLNTHEAAAKALHANKKQLLIIQEQEDMEDRGIKPPEKEEKKESR